MTLSGGRSLRAPAPLFRPPAPGGRNNPLPCPCPPLHRGILCLPRPEAQPARASSLLRPRPRIRNRVQTAPGAVACRRKATAFTRSSPAEGLPAGAHAGELRKNSPSCYANTPVFDHRQQPAEFTPGWPRRPERMQPHGPGKRLPARCERLRDNHFARNRAKVRPAFCSHNVTLSGATMRASACNHERKSGRQGCESPSWSCWV